MIEVKRIKCGNGNCFIISNGDNAILADTCNTEYKEKILNACKSYNIRLIVLTHGHIDHIQNAAYLSKKLNVSIAMSREDVELISDNMTQPLKAKSFLGKIVLALSEKSFREDEIPSFEPAVLLEEGDTLDKYGIPAEIISVSGHTKGSIAIDVDKKYLVVGDALMNMFYPTVSMLYHNEEEMLKSAEKISGLGDRIILFGHGKTIKNRTWVKRKVDHRGA